MPSATAKRRIPFSVLQKCAAAFRVLAHPHRLRIVEILADRKLSVSELAHRIDLPQAACSQHLNLMRAFSLLSATRNGKTVYYEVANRSAIHIIDCIRTHEM